MKSRQLMLALLLAATLAAAFWPWAEDETEVVGAMAKRERGHKPPAVVDSRKPDQPVDPRLGAMRGDLFPAQTWQPPPPPPLKIVPPPPPPPAPPPLAFQYMGRWTEKGKEVFFLTQGSRVLPIQVGDTLAGWHLVQANDKALTFTWTALNMQQILRIAP